jgi:hypothetical protein
LGAAKDKQGCLSYDRAAAVTKRRFGKAPGGTATPIDV